LGWVWVPGYTWAPSWVVFSSGPGYIGWAPVPAYYSIGVSIGHSFCSPDQYVFVDSPNFMASRVRGYAVPVRRNRVLVQNTRIVNNIRVENQVVVNHGPSVRDVERWSGRRIAARPIERVPRFAASERFSRTDLRVDTGRMGRSVRATEPTVASQTSRGQREGATAPRSTERTRLSVSPSLGTRGDRVTSRPQTSRGDTRLDMSRGHREVVTAPRSIERVSPSRDMPSDRMTSRSRVDTAHGRRAFAAPRSMERAPQLVSPSRGDDDGKRRGKR
jgi:hypothetical protein